MTDSMVSINSHRYMASEFSNTIEVMIKEGSDIQKSEFVSQVYLKFCLSHELVGLVECFVFSRYYLYEFTF